MNVYDPAIVTGVHSLAPRPAPESEIEVIRRIHRQQVAAERANSRELGRARNHHGAHGIARPVVAIWALVGSRR
jgi:hypothetical protein